jgi:hypothetical protein
LELLDDYEKEISRLEKETRELKKLREAIEDERYFKVSNDEYLKLLDDYEKEDNDDELRENKFDDNEKDVSDDIGQFNYSELYTDDNEYGEEGDDLNYIDNLDYNYEGVEDELRENKFDDNEKEVSDDINQFNYSELYTDDNEVSDNINQFNYSELYTDDNEYGEEDDDLNYIDTLQYNHEGAEDKLSEIKEDELSEIEFDENGQVNYSNLNWTGPDLNYLDTIQVIDEGAENDPFQ